MRDGNEPEEELEEELADAPEKDESQQEEGKEAEEEVGQVEEEAQTAAFSTSSDVSKLGNAPASSLSERPAIPRPATRETVP
jgi:hypothetical protein